MQKKEIIGTQQVIFLLLITIVILSYVSIPVDANYFNSYYYLDISSDPPGAEVYIDGNYEGITPIESAGIAFLAGSSHTVKISKYGYDDIYRTITANAGETVYISETLIANTGYLSVSSNPSGASVYLDGIYKGITPITLSNVPIGLHTVESRKSGYVDVMNMMVTVSSGQTTYLTNTLTAQPGSISISSNPSDTKVYLDGTYKGTTPLTLNSVSIGSHTVKLSKSGYNDITKVLTVNADQTSYISESLDRIEVPTVTAAPIVTEAPTVTAVPARTVAPAEPETPARTVATEAIMPTNTTTIPQISGILLALLGLTLLAKKMKKYASSPTKSIPQTSPIATEPPAKGTDPANNIKTKDESSINTSSAFGYKGATIIHKIKIKNPTSEPIGDIKIHLFVPDVFLLENKEKSIAMLEPNESKTVTFEIRPTGECGDCNVSGRLNYYDYGTKKRQEIDLETKTLSIVCPLLKIKDITIIEWRNITSRLVRTEETTKEISMSAETLFSMASRVVEDMNMFMLEPETTSTPQMFNCVARFYGEGVKELKYAAQIEVVGGSKKSKLILKAWAERDDALTGFYHRILDELEKRVHVKGYIDDSIVQNFYHYGDNIGTQVRDSFVYKSNVGNGETETCPQCGKKKVEGETFCSGCGMKFKRGFGYLLNQMLQT